MLRTALDFGKNFVGVSMCVSCSCSRPERYLQLIDFGIAEKLVTLTSRTFTDSGHTT